MLINYKDIQAQSKKVVKTGFDFIDQVSGGLIVGQFVGVTGSPGSGKSTFLTQLVERLQEYKILYVCNEENATRQKQRVQRLNLQLDKPENIDFLTLNEARSIEKVIYYNELNNYNFIFIDSLQKMKTSDSKSQSMLKATVKFYQYLQTKKDLSIISIIQSTKNGGLRGSRELEHELDSIIFFDVKKRMGGYDRQVRYSKNRDGAIDKVFKIKLGRLGVADTRVRKTKTNDAVIFSISQLFKQ